MMANEIKLTQEQIIQLENNLINKTEELKKMNKEINEEYTQFKSKHDEGVPCSTIDLLSKYYELKEEILRIESMLKNSKMIEEKNCTSIEVGTIFKGDLYFNEEYVIKYNHFILVQENTEPEKLEGIIPVSLNSEFGKAVEGHCEGDIVSYSINADSAKIYITKILTLEEIRILKSNSHQKKLGTNKGQI